MDTVKQMIEEGAKIEATDKFGDTPLLKATYWGHLKICELLIDNGADLEAEDDEGSTPIIVACLNGHVDIVNLLLDKGANMSAKDEEGFTPLHLACNEGHIDIVKILVDGGADLMEKTNDGNTVYSLANKCKHLEVMDILKLTGTKQSRQNGTPEEKSEISIEEPKPKLQTQITTKRPSVKATDKVQLPPTIEEPHENADDMEVVTSCGCFPRRQGRTAPPQPSVDDQLHLLSMQTSDKDPKKRRMSSWSLTSSDVS